MRLSEDAQGALLCLFQKQKVADLEQLFATIHTRSRMTVFRRLTRIGYYSSYSHTGRFYTLRPVPEFDADGLWQHEGVGFSAAGTLRETLVVLVEKAEDGRLHRELQARLGLRVQNTLADLVEHGRLGREQFESEYLYVSTQAERAATQLARRREKGAGVIPAGVRVEVETSLLLEVLLEVIHGAGVEADAEQVAGRLAARGVSASVAQVAGVFRRYGVEKKTARSRSKRSRP
jgi:hypothetical protein